MYILPLGSDGVRIVFIGIVFVVLIAAVQGAVVFATAYIGFRVLQASRRLAKVAAMAISYCGWIAFTIIGYSLLGSGGGFMDGLGLVLTLCFTAMASSFVYLAAWSLWPSKAALDH